MVRHRMRPPLSQTSGRSRSGSAAHVERLARRERVEVAGQHVEAVAGAAPTLRSSARSSQHAAPLGPRRVHRAQVHAEDAQPLARRHDLEERVARERAAAPTRRARPARGSGSRATAAERAPLGHAGRLGEPLARRPDRVASCSSTRSGAQRVDDRGDARRRGRAPPCRML